MHGCWNLGQKLDIESITFSNQLRSMVADEVRGSTDVEAISDLIEESGREANVEHVHVSKRVQSAGFGYVAILEEYL